PGNNAPIGGLKVVAASGWFAARPSGPENVYRIYAESFKDQKLLDDILSEAQRMGRNAVTTRRTRRADSARGEDGGHAGGRGGWRMERTAVTRSISKSTTRNSWSTSANSSRM